ncbi:MAG: zinc metalloprotease HtpX [Actinomycetota bacterium]|jgi:heat shock protein HtpX|nr:zinc metalloprotease HtpX [Actinomycetota bacterium]
MAPSSTQRFGRDRGLQARMLLTMFLLGAVYVVLVGALFAFGAGGVLILIIAGGLFAAQFFGSEALALRAMGVQQVSPQEAPELHAMIERLCLQADLPKPRLGIVQTEMPNAFAMGRSQKHSTVVVTTGIMDLLSPSELEGVMAHELSHIQSRDVMVMTVASFFASIAAMVMQFGFFFGGGGGDDEGPGILGLIAVSFVVYVVSFFLMQALSRYREFSADRGAAVMTGRPSALSSALMKIGGMMEQIPQDDLRARSELKAFYIFPAGAKKSLFNLFSTHPPMEKRIAALSQVEAQLQAGR